MSDYINLNQDGTAVQRFSRPATTATTTHVDNDDDDSVFRAMACYVRCFLGKSHPLVGREGPVCPFVPTAIRYDTIRIAVLRRAVCADRKEIVRVVKRMMQTYLSIPPTTEPKVAYKAIILTFPDVSLDDAPELIDNVQRELKTTFVEAGLMLGEFHLQNKACGLRNPNFYPLRTPFPSLAIRSMVPSDLVFLNPEGSDVQERSAMLAAYIRKFESDELQEKFVASAKEMLASLIALGD